MKEVSGPKAIRQTVAELLKQFDVEWDGMLWRTGVYGIYYHTQQEGAAFYHGDGPGGPECFDFPNFRTALVIDTDELGDLEDEFDIKFSLDWVSELERLMPRIQESGFDCAIIVGETGAEVEGAPVEVVDLRISLR
jgi:hypothetical protein